MYVFNSNKEYPVARIDSPLSEEVPIDILNRLHRYSRNRTLIGDLNARRPNWQCRFGMTSVAIGVIADLSSRSTKSKI